MMTVIEKHVLKSKRIIMPIKRNMMKELKKKYGKEEGEDMYYAIEMKKKKKVKRVKNEVKWSENGVKVV